jgi:hypothetical protein
MKRLFGPMLLIAIIALFMGMGSPQGSASSDTMPVPVKKFTAKFVDQHDVVTECTEVSIEGMTFLEGKRGGGTFTLSFEGIDQVLFRLNAERLTAVVRLDDGGTYELTLDSRQKAFGRTKYGTFQIKLADLKKMAVAPAVPTR